MRIFLKILKWLFVLLVVLIGIMFAINWNDELPSPAALKMQAILDEGSDVPDEDNAFVYAMGFPAPKGSDPVRAGVECISKLNIAVRKKKVDFESDLKCWESQSSKCKDAVITELLDTCTTANKDCELALQKNEQAIAQWLQDDDWLLRRYEGLLQYSKWKLTAELSPYMPFPHYDVVGNGRKMLLLKAWYLAGQGNAAEVQRLLNQDAMFWRMLLSSSNILLDKLIATTSMGKDFAFSNLVLRRLQAKGASLDIPDVLLVPFSGDELSLKRMMAGEWAYMASSLQKVKMRRVMLMDEGDIFHAEESTVFDALLDDLSGHFFLLQATQNEYAEKLLRMMEILDVPVEQLPLALRQKDTYLKEFDLFDLYNPIGHTLVGIGMYAYSGYIERVYDLEGARQALLATVQLREEGVELDQIEAALGQSEFKNPYDGKPFMWDAETGSIVFKGLGPEGRNTHSFLY